RYFRALVVFMRTSGKRYLVFLSASVASFLLIVAGSEIRARMSIRGENISQALSSSASYADSATATLLMYIPFLAVAWLCASLAQLSWPRAIGLFLVCIATFTAMYYSGYTRSE